MSIKISFAPIWHTTEALAVYVYAQVITSSSPEIPNKRKVISAQAVCELRQTARFVPHKSATSRSSSFVLGPVVIQPDLNASETCSISSSVMSGGENGIFIIIFPPFYLTIILEKTWFHASSFHVFFYPIYI